MLAWPSGAGAIVALSLCMLLGGRPGWAAEPPADLVNRLERDIVTSSAARCPDAGTYSLVRPGPTTAPTIVGLGIFYQDVAHLSDVDQTLDMDVYVVARWRDPRLADSARGEMSADCPTPTGRLWMPQLEPASLRSRQTFYPERFLVDGQGVVTLLRRLWLKVSYPLDFRDFPLDRHHWTMTIWPVESRADEIVFHPLTRHTGISDQLSIQGWRVEAPRLEARTDVRDQRSGTFARLDAVLDLKREWSYYAWKLGLPLTLIVFMAYGVYFIPDTAAPQQIGLGTTAMLTLIAFMLTLGSSLPRISYLTRADRFFVGSAVLVFLGVMKAVATLALAQGPKTGLIEQIDRWGRWIFPFVAVANFVLAFLV
jgi:Neurotransmitter-gated ion-channel ligand binding domain/Neurotransmitter-gated ion-channel transmembrane region